MSARSIFVFDAYGTLFDVVGAARDCADDLGEDWRSVADVWRAKQLEYTWIYGAIGAAISFRDVTRQSLAYALAARRKPSALSTKLLEAYRRLPPYPDAPPALRALRSRGSRLAILSNADADMLDELVRAAGMDDIFDRLVSTSVAATFKPSRSVYALACDELATKPGDATFVSSNRWDIAGAKAFGFQTVWINRQGAPDEYASLAADDILTDLSALAASSGP